MSSRVKFKGDAEYKRLGIDVIRYNGNDCFWPLLRIFADHSTFINEYEFVKADVLLQYANSYYGDAVVNSSFETYGTYSQEKIDRLLQMKNPPLNDENIYAKQIGSAGYVSNR